MFTINPEIELTPKILQKMIEQYQTMVLPNLINYKNYYEGQQKILSKKYQDPSKPCNKTVVNYCKNIADSYDGYLATPGYITYTSHSDIDEIIDILKYNDYQTEDADFLANALIYGVSAELMFIDKMGKTRFKLIDPRECFGIYDDSLTNDLLYFVRIYNIDNWGANDTKAVDVYSNYNITHYHLKNNTLTLLGIEPHYFNQCPANIFYLPDEKSIFDCVLNLQDSMNELLSDEIDDYSAFVDAYLVLTGMDVDPEDVANMRENRVLVLPEGASSGWLTKNSNDTQVENIMKRIHDSIYRISACPDFSSEQFISGVASGIALQYRLTGMETRAGRIEAEMKKALQRRIEIICGIATLKIGEEVFSEVEITFKRNIPEDINSTIGMINQLRGMVSDYTLLAQLPFVNDVDAEMDRVIKQKQDNLELYSFGSTETDEDDTI